MEPVLLQALSDGTKDPSIALLQEFARNSQVPLTDLSCSTSSPIPYSGRSDVAHMGCTIVHDHEMASYVRMEAIDKSCR